MRTSNEPDALASGLTFALGLTLACAAALASAPDAAATSASCVECHDVLAAAFDASAHGRAFRHDDGLAGADCGSCHGDVTRHLESGDAADIQNPARLAGDAATAACMSCHDRGEHRFWPGSAHESADVTCTDCHAVHAAAPAERGLLRTASDLCLSCHTGERLEFGHRYRHPLAEDEMSCASCHAPHGAPGEHLIAQDSINDLCFSCHQEKRAPMLWEHAPVKEDCATCHKPHGSNLEGMLVARPAQLCQSCHLQGRHQSVAGYQTAMWNVHRGCLNCHPQIHGSNHPSGPLFQR